MASFYGEVRDAPVIQLCLRVCVCARANLCVYPTVIYGEL